MSEGGFAVDVVRLQVTVVSGGRVGIEWRVVVLGTTVFFVSVDHY